MHGLLDGDIVLFRCGFAAERTRWHLAWKPSYETSPDGAYSQFTGELLEHADFEFKREATDKLDEVCPGKKSRVEGEDYKLWPEIQLEPLENALNNTKTLIQRLCRECDINEFELRIAFSDSPTFRHKLAKTRPYKGNRSGRRPTYEQEIKNYMKENWDCYTAENEEADDLLGIWQTELGPHESVIISLDKDLDQIPGLKYNWLHDVHYDVTPERAIYNFHMQIMTGDTTDNIVGLPGIGTGKAAKALHGMETEEAQMEEVIRMFQIHSGKEDWAEYLLEMGRLVWIRRESDQLWDVPDYSMQSGVDGDWITDELTLEAD